MSDDVTHQMCLDSCFVACCFGTQLIPKLRFSYVSTTRISRALVLY